MALSMGIVGLPNVGKSTVFNALTKAQNADAANYPFCTIEPNKAIVPVPDKRLEELAKIVNPQRIENSVVEFVDIAGLVKGASKGEGLGNKFLGNIRQTEAIIHVVRCFDDENVIHVDGNPDPIRDVDVIETELIFADLEQLERKLQKLERLSKSNKKLLPQIDMANEIMTLLESGQPVRKYEKFETETCRELLTEMSFITAKDVIYVANTDEDSLDNSNENDYVKQLRAFADERGCEMVKLCAKLEEEMADMSDDDRHEFLASLGADESGLDQVIHKSFKTLGLMSYFTAGVKEVRAWTIHKGWKAPKAAGVIHGDFERGFIRAEVISYEDFIKYQGRENAKANGAMLIKGKDYVVQDGDILNFLFNV